MFRRSVFRLRGEFASQCLEERCNALLMGSRGLARRGVHLRRARHIRSIRNNLRAQLLKPVSKPLRCATIVFVVPLDKLHRIIGKLCRRTQLQLVFDEVPGLIRFGERDIPAVAAEPFKILQRVLFDARPKTLLDDGVQVDEFATPQESVNFLLPSRIAKHEALKRRRLVAPEVIDVQVAMSGHLFKREIDEPFKRCPFLCPVGGPSALIPEGAVLFRRNDAGQILDSSLPSEWITFEIEKNVTKGRSGKSREAFCWRALEQFELELTLRSGF